MKNLFIISVCLSCSLSSTAMQIVAWASMISHEWNVSGSLHHAVSETFEYTATCSLCKLASQLREYEVVNSQGDSSSSVKLTEVSKLVNFFEVTLWVPFSRVHRLPWHTNHLTAERLVLDNITPPPRV